MVKKDYYEILGVKKTDSAETIKKSYKKLALKFHPDKASEDKKKEYEESFKGINEAYSTLCDEEKRKRYDAGESSSFSSKSNSNFGGGDFSDLLRDLFRNGSSGNQFFDEEDTDQDLHYELTIEFKEAVFGCEKEISIKKNILCKSCNGTGAKDNELETCSKCNGNGRLKINQRTPWGVINQTIRCDNCEGKGQIPKSRCRNCSGFGIVVSKEKFKIKIPAGIDNGQTLRVQNGGNTLKNGSKGDLFLFIQVRPNKIFKREKFDVYTELFISFSEAALGGEIAVPILSSEELKIKIVKGTESGSVLRLKGQGIPYVNNPNHRGDEFIIIKVKTPKKLTKAQIQLFEELRKLDK